MRRRLAISTARLAGSSQRPLDRVRGTARQHQSHMFSVRTPGVVDQVLKGLVPGADGVLWDLSVVDTRLQLAWS